MADSHGFAGILGLGIETSNWGTEVVATERFPFLSETLTDNFDQIPDEALEGKAGMRPHEQGIERAVGGFVGNWRYDTTQLLLQHFLGTLAAGQYTLDENLDDTGLTVAIQKTVDVWTFPGYKPSQVTISGDANGIVQIAAENGVAKQLVLASGTNTTGVLAALTNSAENVLFHEMTFQIANLDDHIAAGDAFSVSSFNLVINRNHAPADVNAQQVLEPKEDGRRQVTLSFQLPRYSANTFVTWHRSNTPIQGRIYFTDGAGTKEFLLPHGRVTSAPPNIAGAGLVPVPVEITWYRNAGVNTNAVTYDMNAITEELVLNET